MSTLILSAILLTAQRGPYPHAGNLAILKAKDGVLVYAKTIEVQDAPAGLATEDHEGTHREEAREWKYLVLERMDAFVGTTPHRFKVAIPANEVKLADFFAHPKPGGYSGPGPMYGLQPGDLAVWQLQRPSSSGQYLDYNWFLQEPNPDRTDPAILPSFSAPGSEFALANGRQSVGFIAGSHGMMSGSLEPPQYDHSLPAPIRYADLLAGAAIRDLGAKTTLFQLKQELAALQQVRSEESGDEILPPMGNGAELTAWVEGPLVKRWPQDDEAQLNLLAVRLSLGSPVEPDFLAMLKKVKRPALQAEVPPITNENYFVECCEGDEIYVACEGFGHVRRTKNKDPRVLKAAIKWLDESASSSTDKRRLGDIRGCGLVGDILWYLADTTGDKTLTENWSEPKPADLAAAKQVAQSLLR